MSMDAAASPATSRPRSGQKHGTDHRSAVTNGKRLHVARPGDTAWARRFRDVLAEIISDLGGHDGGLSEAQRAALRAADKVAVSVEPTGGSPSGSPTGPIIIVVGMPSHG